MGKKISKSFPIIFQNLKRYQFADSDIRFQKVKIWLCHLGENLNGSYLSKDVVENAFPTLSNTPILAYIEKNADGENDFSDHREILFKKDGVISTKYLGKAIGVIPETNNAQFEDRLCDDGVTRTFLTVEGLLWTKFDDPIEIMNRDSIKGQSMELADDYEGKFEDDNLFHFSKISFYGACGLGIDVSPAMKNSTIELQFSTIDFKNEINKMTEKFKEKFSNEKNDLDNKDGEAMKKNKKEIASQFSLTVNQMYDEISRSLSESKYNTTNWYDEKVEVCRYHLCDFDEKFIYAVDRMNENIDVKLPYSMSGDNVIVDFESSKRIKYVPTDWEEETEESATDINNRNFTIVLEKEFRESISTIKDKHQKAMDEKNDAFLQLNEKFVNTKNASEQQEKTIELLQQYKEQVENSKRKEKVEMLFTKLSKFLTKEELAEWREKEINYNVLELFEKDLKSFAYDRIVENNKEVKPEFSQMNINVDHEFKSKQTEDVWSRLNK